MRVTIIDPGLLNTHGHHFHTDLVIYQELRRRGTSATVLGHRKVEATISRAMPVVPIFRSPAYPKRDGVDQGGLRSNFEQFNRWVAEDLMAADLPRFSEEDIILIPTARDIHLTGVYQWYTQLPEPRPRICIRLMFLPGFRAKPAEQEAAKQLSRQQLRAWAAIPGDSVVFASESRALSEQYMSICGICPPTFPLIIRYPEFNDVSRRQSSCDGPANFAFLGEARREKGVHLLSDAFGSLLQKYRHLRLTVQTSCLYDVDGEFVRNLQQLSQRVTLQTEALFEANYDRCIGAADVVLIPYDPASYGRRTSLIFLEAVGAGIPVLTTKGTWMHDESLRLGIGDVAIEEFTSRSVAEAVEKLMAHWPRVLANANKAKRMIRNRHNPSRFVDAMLERHCMALR